MTKENNQPAARNWYRWFDLRGRESGTIGFGLNRITAIGLTIYLFLHLIFLGQLAQGPEAYSKFLDIMHNPLVMLGELAVIFAVLFHGINGLRIVLNSFGIGVQRQKPLLAAAFAIAIIGTILFATIMF